jgi:hypothetical protein
MASRADELSTSSDLNGAIAYAKQLEAENARLQKLAAHRGGTIDLLRKLLQQASDSLDSVRQSDHQIAEMRLRQALDMAEDKISRMANPATLKWALDAECEQDEVVRLTKENATLREERDEAIKREMNTVMRLEMAESSLQLANAKLAEALEQRNDARRNQCELAAKKPGRENPAAEASRKVGAEHANRLWQQATGCDIPAEAAEKIGRLEASAVDIELLRWCYRAMQLCSSSIQLDSAANALAEAYPEVKK